MYAATGDAMGTDRPADALLARRLELDADRREESLFAGLSKYLSLDRPRRGLSSAGSLHLPLMDRLSGCPWSPPRGTCADWLRLGAGEPPLDLTPKLDLTALLRTLPIRAGDADGDRANDDPGPRCSPPRPGNLPRWWNSSDAAREFRALDAREWSLSVDLRT